ncbi:hypothetical protein BACPEC_02905 [[Bacteroides] pectinophilus ATCC 43243]|uniref:Uncharacterized protein n=1 Tax=[Bacteroides] pectinophilus ATCC 43243 TaxID=483218 RepID=B7AW04_9FIRM|nr:hypothetical protein BACPEC_02905 [[Bacteroides] pectinophilus ATCC 43243]
MNNDFNMLNNDIIAHNTYNYVLIREYSPITGMMLLSKFFTKNS